MDRTTRITGAAILLLITLVMYGVQRGGTDTAAPVMRPAVRPTPALPRPSDSFPDTPLTAPPGFTVRVYASALGHPRTIVFSPGGTMLVSDPDAGTVTALPDADRSAGRTGHGPSYRAAAYGRTAWRSCAGTCSLRGKRAWTGTSGMKRRCRPHSTEPS